MCFYEISVHPITNVTPLQLAGISFRTLLHLKEENIDIGPYYFAKLLEHPYCALFFSFIQQTCNN